MGHLTRRVRREYDGSSYTDYVTVPTYDDLLRLTRVENRGTYASASDYLVTALKFDGAGRVTRAIAPDGRIDAPSYSGLGDVTRSTEDEAGIARLTDVSLDAAGRLTRLTGYKSGTSDAEHTDYAYDPASDPTRTTYPDGGAVSRYYDVSGQLTARLDQRGITTRYDYDTMARITRQQDDWSSPDVVETYFYSGIGELTLALKGASANPDASAATGMYYNPLGLVTRAEQAVRESTAKVVSHYYDNLARRITLDYPSASVDFAYAMDALGRVTGIKDNGGTTQVEYTYKGFLLDKRRYPTPDVDRDLAYDQLGRLTEIDQQEVSGSTDLASYVYSYDKASNPTKQQFLTRAGDPSSEYEYDSLYRLTYAFYFDASTNGTNEFLYDDVGNRTYHLDRSANSVTYQHSLVNEYTKVSTTARGHDASGNLTDDGTYTYQWDYASRLTRIERNSDSGTVAVLDYDAIGRRVLKYDAVAGSTRRFYYDAARCIEEYNSAATPARQRYFVHGATYVDELAYLNNDVGENTGTFYALHDQLLSVMGLVNTSGAAVERYKYDAYGAVKFQDANFADLGTQTSAYGNPLTFTGRRLDQFDTRSLALMHYRARQYDPALGRFLSRDPLDYLDGMSLYEYALSDPTFYVDPSGLGTDSPALRQALPLAQKLLDLLRRLLPDDDAKAKAAKERAKQKARSVVIHATALKEGACKCARAAGTVAVILAVEAGEREVAAVAGGQVFVLTGDIRPVLDALGDRDARIYIIEAHPRVTRAGVEGGQGGVSIVGSTITFTLTDRVGITDSDKYQGADYDAARVIAVIGREALLGGGNGRCRPGCPRRRPGRDQCQRGPCQL